MSLPINITSAITFIPDSYNSSLQSGSISAQTTGTYAVTNGLNGSGNTSSYALFTGTTQNSDGYAFYNFNATGIPSNATITSVSAVARGRAASNNRGTYGFQLCTSSSTLKGTEVTATTNTSTAMTLTTGSNWTVSDIENLKLRIRLRRTATNTFAFRFYGATVTVNYTVNEIAYEVNVTNNSTLATVSPAYASGMTGEDFTISFDGIVDKSEIVVKDNNVDVTNSLVPIPGDSGTGNFIPSEYVSSASSYDSVYTGSTSDGLADSGSTSRICVYANTGANAVSKLTYKFNCSSIPQDATITNVTCVAGAACYSNGQYFATRTLQLYNGSTAKGTATTITGNGGTKTNETINGGSWTREELNDISLVLYIARGTSNTTTQASFSFWGASLEIDYALPGDGFQYTISNISADHTIVVTDGNVTKYTVNASSSYAGATVSPATQQVVEGRSAEVLIDVDHLYEIIVKDNGTTVTPIDVGTDTYSDFVPSEFVADESVYGNVYQGSTSSGLNGSGNTGTAFVVTANSQTNSSLVYRFNCSSIPENAVITNVDCTARLSGASATYFTTHTVQLYNGSTAKGTAVNSPTTTGTVNLTCGTWTREELNDIKIVYSVYSANGRRFGFYGATLRVTYHVPTYGYELTNVQTNHTITVEEAPYFNVTTANTYAGATVTASPYKVYSGQSTTITVAVANLYEVVIKDNNVDVTSQFTGSNGTYTRILSNVNANHVITIEEAPYYTVSTSSTYSSASVSVSPAKIYSGRNATITVSVPNLYEVKIKLDGTDITNSFTGSNGTYSYTLQNVTANHTLTIEEAQKYLLTASSKYAGVTISPSSVYVYEGQGITFTLQGTVAKIVLKDNNVDVTSSMVQSGSNYLYTISNVSQTHAIEVRVDADYAKVNGDYREVKKFFKKVNGDWQEITKTQFDTQLSEQVFMYGGNFTGTTIVGEVIKSQNAIEIVLNDGALEPGTYKFVYEDAGKEPLDNVDEITQFTISQ